MIESLCADTFPLPPLLCVCVCICLYIYLSVISDSRRGCCMGLSTFIFFLFSTTILSGPYLWNRYSQRLQIECASWSCGLVVHCCLPSNSLGYFFYFFFIFFRQDFVQAISLEPLLPETPNWVCCLVLRSNFALLLTIQFASLFFFSATILSGPYLWNRYSQRLQIDCAAWSCGLIVHYCLPSNSLCYLFFFFPPRFCPGHISGTVTRRDSKLSVLLGPVV